MQRLGTHTASPCRGSAHTQRRHAEARHTHSVAMQRLGTHAASPCPATIGLSSPDPATPRRPASPPPARTNKTTP
eukprot:358860-Chlamydomonas_euryale.AAC.1